MKALSGLALIIGASVFAAPAALAGVSPASVQAGTTFVAETGVAVADPTSPCVTTGTSVRLISSTGNQGGLIRGNPPGFVDVTIVRFDECSKTMLSASYGSADIDRSQFDFIGNGMAGATLSASVPVCDRDDQFACIDGTTRAVAVDMTWTGVGDVSHLTGPPGMNLLPGVYLQLYGGGSFMGRAVLATGTVVDGSSTTSFDSSPVGDLEATHGNSVTVASGPPWQRP